MDKHASRHWIEGWKTNAEKFSGDSIIEISSDNRVLVEGHLGICQYESSIVSVLVKTGCITISGEKLYLDKMTSEYLIIRGRITTVSIDRRR